MIIQLNDIEIKEIIDFINAIYEKEVPGPIKFVIKRKTKKIEHLEPDDFPDSFRKCTIEELIVILKDAYDKKLLRF